MTMRDYITITRPASVVQDPSGAFSGGTDTTVLSGRGDFQPMDRMRTIHLDGTAIDGVNGRFFYSVCSSVATVNVDDRVVIVDEYLRTWTGSVVAVRAVDGTILVRVS